MQLRQDVLHAGVHQVTAVLQHGSSTMFLASSSIFVRPSPPLQQQHQRMQFAAPLYRSDVQLPPMSLVPHLRRDAPAAEDADGDDGSGNHGGAGHDDDADAYAALKGDPVSGGGMKVIIE